MVVDISWMLKYFPFLYFQGWSATAVAEVDVSAMDTILEALHQTTTSILPKLTSAWLFYGAILPISLIIVWMSYPWVLRTPYSYNIPMQIHLLESLYPGNKHFISRLVICTEYLEQPQVNSQVGYPDQNTSYYYSPHFANVSPTYSSTHDIRIEANQRLMTLCTGETCTTITVFKPVFPTYFRAYLLLGLMASPEVP